jgi:hypothetical protein
MTKTSFSSLSSSSTSNPFGAAVPVANPFGAAETPPTRGPQGYALLASGPAVDPSEVENAAQRSVEISIAWGTSLLHVTHLVPPRTFVVGEEDSCDFQLPASHLGLASTPLVVVDQGQTFAVLLPGAEGWIELPGKGRLSLEEVRGSELALPCPLQAEAWMIALPAAARLRQEIGGLVMTVGSVAAGKKVRRALLGAASLTGLLFAGLSFLGHASLLGGLAFFKPELSSADEEQARHEREVLMAQMLKAAAEKEVEPAEQEAEKPAADSAGGEGAAAQGPSGKMGSTISTRSGGKFAVKGRDSNPDPHISREQAREEAARFGMIGLLQANVGGDSNAPVAPWGRDSAGGRDDLSALGNLWGASLGESHGSNGLGLSGIGAGGDGRHEGIGLDRVSTLFGGSGTCKEGSRCDGIGTGPGLKNDHKVKPPQIRMGATTVSGRLPPEVIQRIVRQNFGQFRLCYENGLRNNPNLQGRVSVRFIIDRSGAVSSVGNSGSDLPDSSVVSCVVRSFSGLSFPQPQDGIVTVVYPISFAPSSPLAQQFRDRNRHQVPLRQPPQDLCHLQRPRGGCVCPPPLDPEHPTVRQRRPAPRPPHQGQLQRRGHPDQSGRASTPRRTEEPGARPEVLLEGVDSAGDFVVDTLRGAGKEPGVRRGGEETEVVTCLHRLPEQRGRRSDKGRREEEGSSGLVGVEYGEEHLKVSDLLNLEGEGDPAGTRDRADNFPPHP